MSRPVQSDGVFESPTFELASCQVSLAFERTLITLDQALMSAIRTSLSLIAFGFAMVLFFHELGGDVGVNLRTPARYFGLSLVAIGVGLMTIGLVGHRRGTREIRIRMEDLHRRKLLIDGFPRKQAPVAILAMLLLLSGLLVMAGILVRIGPFG